MDYRGDIDGLRGFAVISVLLYHFDISPFNGGFVGVDVFFVISGYLITSIVQTQLQAGQFSFVCFYERRVRRLLPALVVVILSTQLFGIFVLLPTDLRTLGFSSIATTFFVSNVYFWRSSGYFDGSSELNPLLHTWSLGVEEQFYLFFPVLLLAIRNCSDAKKKYAIAALLFLSFAGTLWFQPHQPTATFYLIIFRAWELFIGGLLAFYQPRSLATRYTREAGASAGLLLIVYSIIAFKPNNDFPGWQAALPVCGTALIIWTGIKGGSIVNQFLRMYFLRKLGLISYSLYLWHWPVATFGKYVYGGPWVAYQQFILVLLSLFLAVLTYKYVEVPFRYRPSHTANALLTHPFRFLITSFSFVLVIATTFLYANGLPWRFSGVVVSLDAERGPQIPFIACQELLPRDYRFPKHCTLGQADEKPAIAVWGDSHALAWAPAFDEALSLEKKSGILLTHSACPPLLDVIAPVRTSCPIFNDEVLLFLEKKVSPDVIVLIGSWLAYADPKSNTQLQDRDGLTGNPQVFAKSVQNMVSRLLAAGKTIWVIGPTPAAVTDIPFAMARSIAFGQSPPNQMPVSVFSERSRYFFKILDQDVALGRIIMTRPDNTLCDKSSCIYELNGNPIYRDNHHLSLFGSLSMVDIIRPVIRRLNDDKSVTASLQH